MLKMKMSIFGKIAKFYILQSDWIILYVGIGSIMLWGGIFFSRDMQADLD